MKSITSKQAFWLIAIISILTILPFLGLSEYHTKGEPRESIVSYSMLESGNWILPRNNGGEIAYKPPFFHWSVAAISKVYGKVTEMTSRLPSAIALIGMTLLGFSFFAKRKGVKIALLAAFITLTNFELHRAGANCRVDMLLTAFTVSALFFFYKWYENGLRGFPWVAILLMSLGSLTKGPVGTLIPCLVTGIFLLLRVVHFFKAFMLMSAWGLLSLIIPFAWYLAAYNQGGKEFLDLVLEENFGRMTNTMSYNSSVNPWPYNFLTLFAGYVPWTLLVVISLFYLTYSRFSFAPKTWWNRFSTWIKSLDPVDLFSLTSIVVIFVFYCIPQSKRSVYLMPIYPFIAYFLAKYMLYLSKTKAKAISIYGGILSIAGLLLFACFIVVKTGVIPDSIFKGKRALDHANMLHGLEQIGGFVSWMLILVPTCLSILWWRFRKKTAIGNESYLIVIIALTMSLYLALDGAYQPAVLNSKSVKAVAAEIDRIAPANQGTLYEFIEEGVKALGDPVHYFEVNFYLGNRIENFYKLRPSDGFLLIGERDADKYLPQFEAEGYHFELLYTAPKRVAGQIARVYQFVKS